MKSGFVIALKHSNKHEAVLTERRKKVPKLLSKVAKWVTKGQEINLNTYQPGFKQSSQKCKVAKNQFWLQLNIKSSPIGYKSPNLVTLPGSTVYASDAWNWYCHKSLFGNLA